MADSTGGAEPARGDDEPRGPGTQRMVAGRLVGAFGPWIVYLLVRGHVGSSAEALAIGGALGAVWVVVRFVVRRRIDWIPLASVAAFAVALAVSYLSGGSALPLELRTSVITGAIGLAFFVSVVVDRPLLIVLAQARAGRDPTAAARLEPILQSPVRRRRVALITAWIGVVLLVDAVVRALLAVYLSPSSYLGVSPPVSWSIIGAGLAPLLIYIRRVRPRPGQADGL